MEAFVIKRKRSNLKTEAWALESLGKEWADLTEQAKKICQRKREMREVIEPLFSAIVILTNKELKNKGIGYFFNEGQYSAGYTVDGPIFFDLHPNGEMGELGYGSRIDQRRAEELYALVCRTKAMSAFIKAFPSVSIAVRANFCDHDGTEDPLPSIRSMLRAQRKR
jgi:hypothetical protein